VTMGSGESVFLRRLPWVTLLTPLGFWPAFGSDFGLGLHLQRRVMAGVATVLGQAFLQLDDPLAVLKPPPSAVSAWTRALSAHISSFFSATPSHSRSSRISMLYPTLLLLPQPVTVTQAQRCIDLPEQIQENLLCICQTRYLN
jgi:hypothetical protein